MRHAHFACLALLLVAGCAEESATCAAGEIRSPDGVCVPDTDLDAATLDVVHEIEVGDGPRAFGRFILSGGSP